MGKISNYASALKAKLTDYFVIASDNNGDLETKKVTTEQIGDAIASDQTHSLLDTSDKTLIGSINEVNSNVGDLSSLTTTNNDSLVDAVNEVDAKHNAKEITYTGNTTSQGFLVSDIDFTTKIRMGYVTDSSSGKYFCILRPSSSYKVVAMVINDNLLPVANASNYTLHIFYSDK